MQKIETRIMTGLRGWLTVATIGAALFCQCPFTRADSLPLQANLHIFLYEASGSPNDVTSTVSIWEDHVYLYDPAPIQVVLDMQDMAVFDTNGNQIGYMVQISQPAISTK